MLSAELHSPWAASTIDRCKSGAEWNCWFYDVKWQSMLNNVLDKLIGLSWKSHHQQTETASTSSVLQAPPAHSHRKNELWWVKQLEMQLNLRLCIVFVYYFAEMAKTWKTLMITVQMVSIKLVLCYIWQKSHKNSCHQSCSLSAKYAADPTEAWQLTVLPMQTP